jgi:hypothetical protein
VIKEIKDPIIDGFILKGYMIDTDEIHKPMTKEKLKKILPPNLGENKTIEFKIEDELSETYLWNILHFDDLCHTLVINSGEEILFRGHFFAGLKSFNGRNKILTLVTCNGGEIL